MSRNGKEKKRERKRKRENRSICEFTKAEPCRATVFCLILLPMMLMFPYKMLYHQSFLVDFSNFRSQPTDLEKAIEYVKSSEYIKYMGRGNPASYKLLLFTVCQSGHGAYRKHGDPGMLCAPWWKSTFAWYNRTKNGVNRDVQVAMVTSNMTKNFINASRSSHWLKLLFTAAFLDTRSNVRGASGNFDTVVFVDADSIVRLPEWNLKAFVDLTMTRSHKTLVLSEDRSYDFISTGEIFAKSPIKDFLWTWYKHAPDYYGEYTSPNETYASGLHVSNLPQKGTSPFESYKSIKTYWKNEEESIQMSKLTKVKSVLQRCWEDYPTHEQGCFHHVFHGLKGDYKETVASQIVVLKASEMHALRLMDPLPNKNFRGTGTAPFLHYCCANYKERVDGMNSCRYLLLKNTSC